MAHTLVAGRKGLCEELRHQVKKGSYQEQDVRLDEEGLSQSCPHTPAP